MKAKRLTLAQAKRNMLRLEADRIKAKLHADQMEKHRDQAFTERDFVVVALSTIWESHLMPATPERMNWKWAVCVHSPQGQLAWRIPDDKLSMFKHLERIVKNHWDGCSTAQKHERLLSLAKG